MLKKLPVPVSHLAVTYKMLSVNRGFFDPSVSGEIMSRADGNFYLNISIFHCASCDNFLLVIHTYHYLCTNKKIPRGGSKPIFSNGKPSTYSIGKCLKQ